MPRIDASGADDMALAAKHAGLELGKKILFASALKAEQYFSEIDICENTCGTTCSARST